MGVNVSKSPERPYSPILYIPFECRLKIYQEFILDHKVVTRRGISLQPNSSHLQLLRTCRLIYREAYDILWEYVSLVSDEEIARFIQHAPQKGFHKIRSADLAVDDRNAVSWESSQLKIGPASKLCFAVRLMNGLQNLRAFVLDREARPPVRDFSQVTPTWFVHRDVEYGMCGTVTTIKNLSSYELFVHSRTSINLFKTVSPGNIRRLRLTSSCFFPQQSSNATSDMSSLQHLILHDLLIVDHLITPSCPLWSSNLISFTYSQVHATFNALADKHLRDLVSGPGRNLQKLMLLGCRELSSTELSACLDRLPRLQYFALSMFYTRDLNANFFRYLPPTLKTLKVRVRNATGVPVLLEDEASWCDEIEAKILFGRHPVHLLCVDFRRSIMYNGRRDQRWQQFANVRGINLSIGSWHLYELDG